MNKVAVVYWSGTGNTEAMAEAIVEGAQANGAEATLFTSSEFDSSLVEQYDSFAFGCPSMGAEVLEDGEFEPMFLDCKPKLVGKKVALFGSYGWGDGEWMRNWVSDCNDAGLTLVNDGLIINETPDEDGLADCKAVGAELAN